jgi:hypothetical protein
MENIVLQSEGFDQPCLEPPTLSAENVDFDLTYSANQQTHRIRLFSQAFLEQSKGERSQNSPTERVSYHVGFLSPKPLVIQREKRHLLIGALSILAITAGISLFGWAWGMELFTAALATTTMLSASFFFLYLKSKKHLTLFVSRTAKAPLIIIDTNTENARAIEAFTQLLSETIAANQLPSGINPLAEETRLLRTFKEAGFISSERYTRYREAIFKQYPSKKVSKIG